jgi:hypothetical protein
LPEQRFSPAASNSTKYGASGTRSIVIGQLIPAIVEVHELVLTSKKSAASIARYIRKIIRGKA